MHKLITSQVSRSVMRSDAKRCRCTRGNISLEFLILAVVAVVMILLVTAFAAGIWSIFFPSEDKATLQSFNTVYSLINAESRSPAQYYSTTLGVYMKSGYQFLLIGPQDQNGKTYCADGEIPMPSQCIAGYACLCILNGDKIEPSKIQESIVQCKSFSTSFLVDQVYEQFNTAHDTTVYTPSSSMGTPSNENTQFTCNRALSNQYQAYIIAERKYNGKSYIYVMINSETNQALDTQFKKITCQTTDTSNLCYGKSDGDIVVGDDSASLAKIYSYCSSQKTPYKSTSVKCTYSQNVKDCVPDCSFGDIRPMCQNAITGCDGYNLDAGINTYAAEGEAGYVMCKNDAKYCNIGGCSIYTPSIYTCKKNLGFWNDIGTSWSGDCHPPDGCVQKYISIPASSQTQLFITSYDTSNSNCKSYMDTNFYQDNSVYACKQNDYTACKQFIADKKSDCELVSLIQGSYIWLVHYSDSCQKDVDNLFNKVTYCVSS